MWKTRFWHHSVHNRLDETLHYYFMRVRQHDPPKIKSTLAKIFRKNDLGSYRCLNVFGRYDFLIEVWLNPTIANKLTEWLKMSMNCFFIKRFSAQHLEHVWYQRPIGDSTETLAQVNDLTSEAILNIQNGQDEELLEDFLSKGLILDLDPSDLPEFFLAVKLEAASTDEEIHISDKMVTYSVSENAFEHLSVYRGDGEFTLLLTGRAKNYFNIRQLPLWLNENFRNAHTETYLSLDPEHMLGNGKIGLSTFRALEGRDLFVQALIPEMYTRSFNTEEDSRGQVADFVKKKLTKIKLTPGLKRLSKEYLLGYLQDDNLEIQKTLFGFFASIESFLRGASGEYLGRTCEKKISEIYLKVGMADKKQRTHMALGKILDVYMAALEEQEIIEYHDVNRGWEQLSQLRNRVMHGELKISSDEWSQPLEVILEQSERLLKLFELVEVETGKRYPGDYI